MKGKTFLFGLMLALTVPFSSQAYEVVLDNFDTLPYVTNNPNGDFTTVAFPQFATPGGWPWTYGGYGPPASGAGQNTYAVSGNAWQFNMPEGANLDDDPYDPSPDLNRQGPVIYAVLPPQTFDQTIAALTEPSVDWLSPVTFKVSVAGSDPAGWSVFEQGIFIFSWSGSVLSFTNTTSTNLSTFVDASIEVTGRNQNNVTFGLFGALSFTSAGEGDRSPAATMIFDNLRIDYTPYEPAISLKKTVGIEPGVCAVTKEITLPPPGRTVYYCYTVTNTGPNPLEYHDLVDSQLGPLRTQFNLSLQPGQTEFIIQEAYIGETTENSATWAAYQFSDTPSANATATDSALVEVVAQVPAITEWGMIVLSLLLIGLASRFLARRKKTI